MASATKEVSEELSGWAPGEVSGWASEEALVMSLFASFRIAPWLEGLEAAVWAESPTLTPLLL
jgi:hypothetical protein